MKHDPIEELQSFYDRIDTSTPPQRQCVRVPDSLLGLAFGTAIVLILVAVSARNRPTGTGPLPMGQQMESFGIAVHQPAVRPAKSRTEVFTWRV